MAMRRHARGGLLSRDQLSFFDPTGQLHALRDEAAHLEEAERGFAERARFLRQAIDRTHDAIAEFRSAVEAIRADQVRAGEIRRDDLIVRFTDGGAPLILHRGGGQEQRFAALLAGRWAKLDECAFEVIDERSGFTLTAAVMHDDGDAWLELELLGPSSQLYRDDDGLAIMDSTAQEQLLAGFDRLIHAIPETLQSYEQALARGEAELAGHERQLDAQAFEQAGAEG